MKNRVLGIMAVARSLGDHGMKEFVIGRPYVNTVEISLSKSGSKISDDRNDGVVSKSSSEFVIIGCGKWQGQSIDFSLMERNPCFQKCLFVLDLQNFFHVQTPIF